MISTIAHVDAKLASWEGLAFARDQHADGGETWRLILLGGKDRDYKDEELPFASSGEAFGRAMGLAPEAEYALAQAIRTIQSATQYRAYQIASEYGRRLEESGHKIKIYVRYDEGTVINGKRYTADSFSAQLNATRHWYEEMLIATWYTKAAGASRRTTRRMTATVHQSTRTHKIRSRGDLDAWVHTMSILSA